MAPPRAAPPTALLQLAVVGLAGAVSLAAVLGAAPPGPAAQGPGAGSAGLGTGSGGNDAWLAATAGGTPGLAGAGPLGVVEIDHGDGDGHDHGGGDVPLVPRPSIVGTMPYDGPEDAAGLDAACPAAGDEGVDRVACLEAALLRLLEARGSEAAFLALEQLAAADPAVDAKSHPVAHVLGRHALAAYGSIQEALRTCSYRVFGGCLHGALQAYFGALPTIRGSDVVGLCPEDTPFIAYTCYHGLGHGLFVGTRHDLPRSLGLCDALDDWWATSSCHGGVFMENVVGYKAQQAGGHGHGGDSAGHGHGDLPPYAVDPEDLHHPCDTLAAHHQPGCWSTQTSLILYLTHGSFGQVAEQCSQLLLLSQQRCWRALGSDAGGWFLRDPARVVPICALGDAEGRAHCIAGYAAETVINYVSPEAGLRLCFELPWEDRAPCYREVAFQGQTIVGAARMLELCDTAPPAHVGPCREVAERYLPA